MILFGTYAHSQYSIDYPRCDIDSNGQHIVIMTIQQAQSLDNATDLLNLLEKLNIQMIDYDSVCINVVNAKDKVIISQKLEINNLKESLDNKNQQIVILQNEISSYNKKISIMQDIIDNRQQIVDLKDKQIKKLKSNLIWGGIGGGALITVLILALIAK
jgi:hypothetical protein